MVTESCLAIDDTVPLVETSPPGYSYLNKPEASGRGGGVVVVYKNCFKCSMIDFVIFSSFEHLCFLLKGSLETVCMLVYRTPKSSGFISD